MAQKFLTDIEVTQGLVDSSGDLGAAGQVLSSTGTGTNWITNEANSTVVYLNEFTGDNSTVDFTLSVSVTDENITQVYLDGVYQHKDTYSISNTTLTFSTAPPLNADIEVITFSTATTADDLQAGVVIIPVKNTHTASIAKGEPVYITGNVGSSARLQIAPADASNSAKMPAAGLLLQTLAVNAEGYVVTGGYLRNITTDTIDGTSTSSNDTVYVKSGGGLTMTKPTGTNLIQNIAKVARSASGNAGSLLVSSILRTNDVPNEIDRNVNFSDDSKLTFGNIASPDLQIYHDGSNSYIKDTGTGDLRIWGDNVNIGTASGNKVFFNNSGIAELYYTGGVKKFETTSLGIEVTGGADTQAVITGTTTAARLDIKTNSHHRFLQTIESDGRFRLYNQTTGSEQFSIASNNNATFAGNITFGDSHFIGDDASDNLLIQSSSGENIIIDSLDETLFRINGSTKVQIKSSGNVGIGTDSPDAKLSVHSAVNNSAIEIVPTTDDNNADTAVLRLWGTKFGTANRYSEIRNVTDGSTANNELAFNTNGSERMRIDSSGNVLIGASATTDGKLNIVADGETTNFVKLKSTKGTGNIYGFKTNGANSEVLAIMDITAGNRLAALGQSEVSFATGGTTRLLINSSGNIGIGTTLPTQKLEVAGNIAIHNSTNAPFIDFVESGATSDSKARITMDQIDTNNGTLIFSTEGSGTLTERMRIDSSGRVGIGVTPESWGTSGDTKVLRISTMSSLSEAFDGTILASNFYFDGSNDKYIQSDFATQYLQIDGTHLFKVAASGTANNNISFTTALTIANNANVGIGTTSPNSKLNINGASAHLNFTGSNNRINFSGYRAIEGSHTGSLLQIGESYSALALYGNVGIGVTSPLAKFHIHGSGDLIRAVSTNTGASGAQMDLIHHTTSPANNDVHGVINFGGYYSGTNQSYGASIRSVWTDVGNQHGQLQFFTRDGSDFNERAKIDMHGYASTAKVHSNSSADVVNTTFNLEPFTFQGHGKKFLGQFVIRDGSRYLDVAINSTANNIMFYIYVIGYLYNRGTYVGITSGYTYTNNSILNQNNGDILDLGVAKSVVAYRGTNSTAGNYTGYLCFRFDSGSNSYSEGQLQVYISSHTLSWVRFADVHAVVQNDTTNNYFAQ